MMADLEEKPERRFKCSCGRSYLSHPALYTHVKYKHGGQAPEGTNMYSKHKRPRGRPRKILEDTPFTALNEQSIDEIILKKQGLFGTTAEPWNILENMKSSLYSKYLFWLVQEESKKELKENLTIDDVLAIYLIELGESVNEEGFYEFLKYIHFFRECINENGEEIFEWDEIAEEYSTVKGPSEVPVASNVFIETYLPIRRGSDRKFGILVVLHFCSWLFSHAYTTYKLTLLQKLY